MRNALPRFLMGVLSITALAFGFAPAFDTDAELEAVKWEFFLSPDGSGCDNCCPGGLSLCCDVPASCS